MRRRHDRAAAPVPRTSYGRSDHDGTVRSFVEARTACEGGRGSRSRRVDHRQGNAAVRGRPGVGGRTTGGDRAPAARVAAEDTASDWFAGVRSDWATHVTTARAKVQAKKAKADAKSAQRDAEFATVYAEDAIDFAIGAVEEAEYAVLDAILAQMDADELATATR